MTPRVRALAETVWRYHRLGHALVKADVILVLCSHDLLVAETAAALVLEGWAPWLVFSGGFGAITRRLWTEPEADRFAAIAERLGVPRAAMLVENRSTNTGENIRFSRRLLEERGLYPERVILVQKPYMERRAYATFRKLWPEPAAVVTSPALSFDDYLEAAGAGPLSVDEIVGIMVGDLQRIRLYAERGFQIPQDIPDDVWAAFGELVAAGYDTHLVQGAAPSPGAQPR